MTAEDCTRLRKADELCGGVMATSNSSFTLLMTRSGMGLSFRFATDAIPLSFSLTRLADRKQQPAPTNKTNQILPGHGMGELEKSGAASLLRLPSGSQVEAGIPRCRRYDLSSDVWISGLGKRYGGSCLPLVAGNGFLHAEPRSPRWDFRAHSHPRQCDNNVLGNPASVPAF